jgi:hypothetical protein
MRAMILQAVSIDAAAPYRSPALVWQTGLVVMFKQVRKDEGSAIGPYGLERRLPPLWLLHHQCTEEGSRVLPSLIGPVLEARDEQFSDSLRSLPSGEKGRRAS